MLGKVRWLAVLVLALALPLSLQAAVQGVDVVYKDGATPLKGYLAFDDAIKGKRPGVLVVHEWWGHNEYARERARQLAELGYIALAVDMYGNGRQASHPGEAQKFSAEIANNMTLGSKRFFAAMKYLQSNHLTDAEHIAAIGYCFGGAVVLQMARDGMDLDAVVSFHGSLRSPKPARADNIKAKVMVAHGALDAMVKAEDITLFISEMNQAGVDYQFDIYGGAQHSFTNPAADEYGKKFSLPLAYNKVADEESWAAMGRFLERAFRGE